MFLPHIPHPTSTHTTHTHTHYTQQTNNHQIANLGLPSADMLRRLQLLKADRGGLSAADERRYIALRR